MTIASLKKQVKQYSSDEQTIAELSQRKANAEAELTELENDTATDTDKLADLAAEHNASISDCTFRLNALVKRLKVHKGQIALQIKDEKEEYREYKSSIRQQRQSLAKGVIESDEFQLFIEKLRALYAGGDYYNYDALICQVIPRDCSHSESLELAQKHGLWIDENDIDPAIKQAEEAIDIDREQRLFHESFANMGDLKSHLLIGVEA